MMDVDVIRSTLRQQLDEIELLQVLQPDLWVFSITDLCFMCEGDVP